MENNLNKLLASKLYALRRNANLKQSDLAERLCISQQAYSKLETGVTKFNDHIVDILCGIFNISRKEFLNCETEKNNRDDKLCLSGVEGNGDEKITEDLSLLIKDEIAMIREERKMLIEFIINQEMEFKRERATFLKQVQEMFDREYRLNS
ncbi:MAG: helix-turn-helix transcriptional regulator [Bacteroidota bacterium]